MSYNTWNDINSYGCEDYAKFGWCKMDGNYGSNWNMSSMGTFLNYATISNVNDIYHYVSALNCPQCGCTGI